MEDSTGSKRKLPLSKYDDDLPGSLPNISSDRPRKQTNRRIRRGQLEKIMSMPVEIFCKIASNVAPGDLLHLARSATIIRNFLMSKASKVIWDAAEEAYGLPECPPDLHSPQYASLLFDKFCMLCNETQKLKCFFVFRVRLCPKCSSNSINFGWRIDGTRTIPMEEANNNVFSLVPAYKHLTRTYRQPNLSMLFNDIEGQSGSSVFYVPAFAAALERYVSFPPSDDRLKFVSERHAITLQIKTHARKLEDWSNERRKVQSNERAKIKEERLNNIYERLKILGYSDDDFESLNDEKEWKWKKLIEIPKALTERAWENLHPQLEKTIRLRWEKSQPATTERRRTKLIGLVTEVMSSFKKSFVTVEDVLQLPMVQRVMDEPNPHVSFDGVDCLMLRDEIIKLGKEWLDRFEEQCAALLLDGKYEFGMDVPAYSHWGIILQLATSFFAVRQRASHSGLTLMTFDELVEEIRKEYLETLSENRGSFEWSFKSRVYSAPSILIKALYEEVKVSAASHEEMVRKNWSFTCLRCVPELRRDMTWTDLVRHYYIMNVDLAREEGSWVYVMNYITANDHAQLYRGRLACCNINKLKVATVRPVDLVRWIEPCRCDFNGFRDPFCVCLRTMNNPDTSLPTCIGLFES